MEYRRLARRDKSLGTLAWVMVTYGSQVDIDAAADMIKFAYDNGVNFLTTPRAMPAVSRKKSWALR